MQRQIKCVVVGDGLVGKSSIIARYIKGVFEEDIGHGFRQHIGHVMVAYIDKPVTLELWDTPGQDGYERLRRLAYQQADVFILCFSVMKRCSFENVRLTWRPEIQCRYQKTPILLVGTKTDLRKNKKAPKELKEYILEPITFDQGQELARDIKAVKYLECSALTKRGIKNVFDEAILAALRHQNFFDEATLAAAHHKKTCVML